MEAYSLGLLTPGLDSHPFQVFSWVMSQENLLGDSLCTMVQWTMKVHYQAPRRLYCVGPLNMIHTDILQRGAEDTLCHRDVLGLNIDGVVRLRITLLRCKE